MKKEICHVCGKLKKPYIVFLTNNIFSIIDHHAARRDGPICERCNKYYGMTGEFKDATDKEFKIAEDAKEFSRIVFRWWFKDKEEKFDNFNNREWPGMIELANWYRKFKEK